MVKIRLFLTGKKHQRSYRLVVVDSRKKRNSQTLETIGFYNPSINPPAIRIDQEKLKYWLSKGAQLTETVRNLVKNEKTA